MSGVEFTDDLPADEPHRSKPGPKEAGYVADLRGNPGYWALIATYPNTPRGRGQAAARGRSFQQRHPEGEYAVRRVDGENRLYLRWRTP